MELDRRALLELAGAGAAVSMGATAGCLDTVGLDDGTGDGGQGDGDGRGVPAYARWVSWDEENDGTFYAYVDWKGLSELDDFDAGAELNGSVGEAGSTDGGELDDESVFEHDDPMLALPSVSILIVALGAGFGLVGTGLSGLLSPADGADDEADENTSETDFGMGETTAADFESAVEAVLMVNDAFVLVGDVDTDEIDDTLTEPPESEWGFKTVYEQTDEIGEFVVYEPADDGEDENSFSMVQDHAIAVSADAIVFTTGDEATDAIDDVRGPIEAAAGDGKRAADENDDVAWMLEAAGHGHVAFGGYGDFDDETDAADGTGEMEIDPEGTGEFEELDGARGVVASLTIDGESESTGELAAVFDELDDEAKATIEEEFGSSADDVSHDVGDDRVTVSATWNEDVVAEDP
ncbi:hypothetical protein [Halosolutus halophilus]|uniref:hypothetical protein n=1 Tax=Halosolutus halophilus TaxID=1552990 RepID=UPI0022352DD4|nr:hypothetical protein [Halosolutus halophilus]